MCSINEETKVGTKHLNEELPTTFSHLPSPVPSSNQRAKNPPSPPTQYIISVLLRQRIYTTYVLSVSQATSPSSSIQFKQGNRRKEEMANKDPKRGRERNGMEREEKGRH